MYAIALSWLVITATKTSGFCVMPTKLAVVGTARVCANSIRKITNSILNPFRIRLLLGFTAQVRKGFGFAKSIAHQFRTRDFCSRFSRETLHGRDLPTDLPTDLPADLPMTKLEAATAAKLSKRRSDFAFAIRAALEQFDTIVRAEVFVAGARYGPSALWADVICGFAAVLRFHSLILGFWEGQTRGSSFPQI